jgi:hypothetical protein
VVGKKLDYATFLHVPRTRLIFSLVSFTNTITTGTPDFASKIIDTTTLYDNSARLLSMLHLKHQDIGATVTLSEKLCR